MRICLKIQGFVSGIRHSCLVPCAVLHVCRLEAGYMSKSLVKNIGSISIEFK